MILLNLASRVRVFIWSFISRGWFSVILSISLGTKEDEDEDRFVIGHTHKGEGITVVLMAGGFLER